RRAEALQLTELRDGRTAALDLMATHLAEGHANIAYAIYRKYAGPDGGWPLPDTLLSSLVAGLVQQKMWPECMALLRQVIANYPTQADAARLKLAQMLIEAEQRPRQALAVLRKLPPELPEAQDHRRTQLKSLAEQAIEEGELEVAVEDW
ncbi:MAG: hypothetical protein K8T25_23480, partial [Planctomycetia bacterium]|nr:hypothetical protein [Planctomycetia bacterium]